MADSWADLGSVTTKFLTMPNWAENPLLDLMLTRNILNFPGTGFELYSVSSMIPIIVEYEFLNMSKNDEYSLLSFFARCSGRLRKFWLPIRKAYFNLASTIQPGATSITVTDSSFYDIHGGYERIYLELADGSMISRHVTDVAKGGNQTVVLTINTAMDRQVMPANVLCFGRLILCRLDNDSLTLNMITNAASKYSLRFYELVREYEAL